MTIAHLGRLSVAATFEALALIPYFLLGYGGQGEIQVNQLLLDFLQQDAQPTIYSKDTDK